MSAKSLTELFSPATFASYRIWDSYYLPRLPSTPGGVMEVIERDLRELEPFCLDRLCAYLHVGLGTLTAVAGSAAEEPEQIRRILNRWPDRVLGIIHLNANQVAPSLRALDEWIAHGRAVGVCFKSAAPGALVCTHPNFDPLVQRCGELGAVIMQHTWFKTHGKGDPGESTPAELAILARRHPQVTFSDGLLHARDAFISSGFRRWMPSTACPPPSLSSSSAALRRRDRRSGPLRRSPIYCACFIHARVTTRRSKATSMARPFLRTRPPAHVRDATGWAEFMR